MSQQREWAFAKLIVWLGHQLTLAGGHIVQGSAVQTRVSDIRDEMHLTLLGFYPLLT